ncbi:MAG: hypothetical protein M3R69_00790 [Acidobacteriota bacterium]|nr:hypothetical protein [Acidobacteriota bacterium]
MQIKRSLAVAAALLIVGVPLLAQRWLAARDTHYDETVNAYECQREMCQADFNGDGIIGVVEQKDVDPGKPSNRVLTVMDDGQEMLQLPYSYVDGTLRTHAAIRTEAGKARLLIFDGTKGKTGVVRTVFAWNGQKLSETAPSIDDLTILNAMAARDDAGTWSEWALFRAFSVPLLIGYYLLLLGVLIGAGLSYRFWFKATNLS